MKQLRDYIHYYIGCECYDIFNDCKIMLTPKTYFGYIENWDKPEDGQIKLILRSLEDITEKHCDQYNRISQTLFSLAEGKNQILSQAAAMHFLLKQGYDLFDLIHAGLAVDHKTIKPYNENKLP